MNDEKNIEKENKEVEKPKSPEAPPVPKGDEINILERELGVPPDWKPKESKDEVDPNLDPNNPEDLKKIEEEATKIYKKKTKEDKASAIETTSEYQRKISTEEEMLEFFDREEDYDLKIVWDGIRFDFKVKPLEPGDKIASLNIDLDLVSDLPLKTRAALAKKSQGQPLTAREQKLVDDIEKDMVPNDQGEILNLANEVLATYLTPPAFNDIGNKEERLEARKSWWSRRKMSFKIFLMGQVMEKIGLDINANYKLFRPRGEP